MRSLDSLPPAYFEEMFAGTPDPWGFETSPYEQAKYDHTLAALGSRHYPNALEIGCANGVLTQRLAGHCDALLALDVSETALARATSRCATLGGVRFVRMNFPIEVPAQGEFDLIVLSEVAYYWNNADLALAASRLLALLAPGGDLILVHWTGETDYPQSGDSAVEALQGAMAGELERVRHEREVKYRLDLWRRWPE
ncbi:MAG: methyltransferase domain-containing protein [Hyphomicrobiales bacterium]|nr:MAG: methyltransferase domain-containing protein [Hyphomicrobiales bacterium]